VFVERPVFTGLSNRNVTKKCQQNFLPHTHAHIRLQNKGTQIVKVGAKQKSFAARYPAHTENHREKNYTHMD